MDRNHRTKEISFPCLILIRVSSVIGDKSYFLISIMFVGSLQTFVWVEFPFYSTGQHDFIIFKISLELVNPSATF